jgi:hypothetical protein
MVAAKFSPSRFPNRYGVIPFAFPTTVGLSGLGAISDALVCRRHNEPAMPAVLEDKMVLLKSAKSD